MNNTAYPSQFPKLFPASSTVQGYLAQSAGPYTVTFDLRNFHLSKCTVFGIWNITEEDSLYSIEVFDCSNAKIAPPFVNYFNFLGWDDNLLDNNIGWYHMTLNPNNGNLLTSQFKQGGTDCDAAFWNNIPPNACQIVVTGNLGPADGVVFYFAEPKPCCTLICPSNITVTTSCTNPVVVSYPAPTPSAECGADLAIVCNPSSGSTFPPGTTRVTCRAAGSQGNVAPCSFTVTVIPGPDTTPPVIDCTCVQVVVPPRVIACSYTVPDLCQLRECFRDDCTPVSQLTCAQSPSAGAVLPAGASYVITLTVWDAAGNSNQCQVGVSVIAPIQTRVWNTGMGGASGNVPLAAGTMDPNYALVSFPAGGCPLPQGPAQVIDSAFSPGGWLQNLPASKWIGPAIRVPNCPVGVYHYQLRFDLACTNSASIVGRFASDDFAVIELNGKLQAGAATYNAWTPVNITSDFVTGPNVLDIYVTNAIVYTGLRAELTNSYNCCCPAQIECTNIVKQTYCAPGWWGTAGIPVYYPPPKPGSPCVNVVCTPPSGSSFPVAFTPTVTTVTCTGTDSLGNVSTCSFTVTVIYVPGRPDLCDLAPRLRIGLSERDIVFSWPESFTDFTLEETEQLLGPSTTVWTTVTNTPTTVEGQHRITLAPDHRPRRFYRLKGSPH